MFLVRNLLGILLFVLCASAAHAQTACVPNPNDSGPPYVNGCPLTALGLNALAGAPQIVQAAAQPGSDMGAKINAALALLPAAGGIVDARSLGGNQTLSTAISCTNAEILFGVAVITQSAAITMGQDCAIRGMDSGIGQGNNFGLTRFVMASAANLAKMIAVAGGQDYVGNIVVDGNKSQNSTSGPNILITNSHYYLENITTQNSNDAGWKLLSTGLLDQACCGTMHNVVATMNKGDGGFCVATADTIMTDVQFENNSGNAGLELQNCPSTRLANYDFGANQLGLWAYGNSGTSLGSWGEIIGSGQWGNQAKQDVLIDGSNTGSWNNQITGAQFIGSQTRPAATYPVIEMHDMSLGGNVLTGLQINGGVNASTNTPTAAIYIHGTEGQDAVSSLVTSGFFSGIGLQVLASTNLSNACDETVPACETTSNLVGATGNSVTMSGVTTFLGADGQDAFNTGASGWIFPQACPITGFSIALTNAPGAGNTETYTLLEDGVTSMSMSGTISGASSFGTSASGYFVIPTGHLVSLQVVGTSGSATTQVRYVINKRC